MRLILPTLYSQMDSRWGKVLLGFNTQSNYNIYNYGCLITCLAMVAKYYGYDATPVIINDGLKDKKQFVNGGLYVWGGITKLYSKISEKLVRTPTPLTDAQYAEIKASLDKGFPVMLYIDYNPNTVEPDQHYVLCIGYNPSDENDLTIADPLGGTAKSLKSYLKGTKPTMRKTVEQYIIYEGTVPTTGGVVDPSKLTSDQLDELDYPKKNPEGNIRKIYFYVTEWWIEKTARIKAEETADDTRKDCEEQIKNLESKQKDEIKKVQDDLNNQFAIQLQNDQTKYQNMVSEYEGKLTDKQLLIDDLVSKGVQKDTKIKDLETSLENLKNDKLEKLDAVQLFNLLVAKLFSGKKDQ